MVRGMARGKGTARPRGTQKGRVEKDHGGVEIKRMTAPGRRKIGGNKTSEDLSKKKVGKK